LLQLLAAGFGPSRLGAVPLANGSFRSIPELKTGAPARKPGSTPHPSLETERVREATPYARMSKNPD
jgi:hypothetical protein